jgi:hypothetical protein
MRHKFFRVTTRLPEPGENSIFVHGDSIPGEVLPGWRAFACAWFLSVVGRTTAHVYEHVEHPSLPSLWRWRKTFWGD